MSVSALRSSDTAKVGPSETLKPESLSSGLNPQLLQSVQVALEARLGEASMTIGELMALKSGGVITLDTGIADLVGLFLNNTLVARGEIVAVEGKFAVRIVEIAPP